MYLDQAVFYLVVHYLEVPFWGNIYLASERNVCYNEVCAISLTRIQFAPTKIVHSKEVSRYMGCLL